LICQVIETAPDGQETLFSGESDLPIGGFPANLATLCATGNHFVVAVGKGSPFEDECAGSALSVVRYDLDEDGALDPYYSFGCPPTGFKANYPQLAGSPQGVILCFVTGEEAQCGLLPEDISSFTPAYQVADTGYIRLAEAGNGFLLARMSTASELMVHFLDSSLSEEAVVNAAAGSGILGVVEVAGQAWVATRTPEESNLFEIHRVARDGTDLGTVTLPVLNNSGILSYGDLAIASDGERLGFVRGSATEQGGTDLHFGSVTQDGTVRAQRIFHHPDECVNIRTFLHAWGEQWVVIWSTGTRLDGKKIRQMLRVSSTGQVLEGPVDLAMGNILIHSSLDQQRNMLWMMGTFELNTLDFFVRATGWLP
jgi:hypothetical protein